MPAREEWHVASVIVHATPARSDAVRTAIAGQPGAAIHAEAPGKFIVVLEAASAGDLAERMTALGRLDGVMAATLVFHQVEDTAAVEEETPC